MAEMAFKGVMPAITTHLAPDLSIEHQALRHHVDWLIGHGVTGIVPLGSLGEGATMSFDEKAAVLESCVAAANGRAPIVPGIASLSTAEAVSLAKAAERIGCGGLMILPPYVYQGPWSEIKAHFVAMLEATPLPCMLYNNPAAYGTDTTPEQIAELAAEYDNLAAIKESSGDVRRITAIRALVGDRLALFAGLDDMVVEALAMGAVGWIAGLISALPRESVALFNLARAGESQKAFELYRWFLPLLRLDTVPEFVQLIKLVQAELGTGTETVRPPRQALATEQREATLALIRERMAARPTLD